MGNIFKEFYTCPSCGRAISGEKRRYFICQSCGKALCEESKLADFDNNYCGNCGAEVASAKRMALAENKGKIDYILDAAEEMTEEKIKTAPEAEKGLCRYFMEHNSEKKIIKIRPGNGTYIALHGAEDVEHFLEAIQDYSRKVF